MLDSAVQVQGLPCLPQAAMTLYLLDVLSYFGTLLVDPEHVTRYGEISLIPRAIPVIALAIILQVVAVTVTDHFPYRVLVVVAVADLTILITNDRSSVGSTAVMVVIWYLVRYRIPDWQATLFTNIIVFNLVFPIREVYSGEHRSAAVIVFLPAHLLWRYLFPVVAAEYTLGCKRLHQALRDKAELLERERRLFKREEHERTACELRASRNALAHDLHDIAGHHLSGVIVSVQAATALRHKDPERSNQTLQTMQDSARTTLTDLRQVVSLLRSRDRSGSQCGGQVTDGQQSELMPSSTEATVELAAVTDSRMAREPVFLPSLEVVLHLVEEPHRRQQRVGYAVNGRPCPLSPLADTTAYRMVQEPLANCVRRTPETPCQVRITYQRGCVEIAVSNRCPSNAETCQTGADSKGGSYGLSDIAERTALVGAELITGSDPGDGWRNRLVIPIPPAGAGGSRTEEEAVIS